MPLRDPAADGVRDVYAHLLQPCAKFSLSGLVPIQGLVGFSAELLEVLLTPDRCLNRVVVPVQLVKRVDDFAESINTFYNIKIKMSCSLPTTFRETLQKRQRAVALTIRAPPLAKFAEQLQPAAVVAVMLRLAVKVQWHRLRQACIKSSLISALRLLPRGSLLPS